MILCLIFKTIAILLFGFTCYDAGKRKGKANLAKSIRPDVERLKDLIKKI